jgi:hypothetical protein
VTAFIEQVLSITKLGEKRMWFGENTDHWQNGYASVAGEVGVLGEHLSSIVWANLSVFKLAKNTNLGEWIVYIVLPY